jgi:hypothetical protein
MYIKLVELVPHILDQVRLKVQKYQSKSQMRLPLKNGCDTSRCLVSDRWSNNKNASTQDQPECAESKTG